MPEYIQLWRNKFLTLHATSIEEMAATLESSAIELKEMAADGIYLRDDGGIEDDYATLATEDPDIAAKYGFAEDGNETWDEEFEFEFDEDGEEDE